ncbi:MAG: glycerol kinase GlpK [Bdellovibrionaceae bacterium]|jgi:glycerol kinase|nr:glycerol kinase GlpK [Pseudobdellovibrionaceae bacterium]
MEKYIIAIDQGTTGTTVNLINEKGICIEKVNKEFPQIFPKAAWVEHNLDDIWQTVLYGLEFVVQKSNINPKNIVAIGITNQRETVALWDKKTGKSVYNAIVWQCRRTTEYCEKLKKKGLEKTIKAKTGLMLDPYFSASKVNWVLKNVKGVRDKVKKSQLVLGTIDTYLLWKLTQGKSHKTDVSNASRTMLMNIKTGSWDKELLKIFSINENLLPEICASNEVFGVTKNIKGLPDGIPISGIAGDQQAALFGQACFLAGEAKCTFGTGSFILMNTGSELKKSKSGLLTTVAWQLKGKKINYALEGGAFVCGATIQWLRDEMNFVKESPEIEELARTVPDTQGVELVPAFAGLGAPYWKPEARGIICGLTRGTKKAHIARAALEAMALQNVDILKAMEKDLSKSLRSLKVDGGASKNNLLMQMQSDFLGKTIVRPKMIETTSLGAAYLAGLGVGLWKNTKAIKDIWSMDKSFKPAMPASKRKARLELWQSNVKRSF